MPTPAHPIRLYGVKLSGHSHRAELMLKLLKLPYEFHAIDLSKGVQKSADFLKLNPFGLVPVIDDGGTVIADSVAILVYLATKYDESRRWQPTEAVSTARVQQWLSVAQGPVFNGPARARLFKLFQQPLNYDAAKTIAENLFTVLESHLTGRSFLAEDHPTIADIALYSYVAAAPEGGLPLAPYPAIGAWLARLEALLNFYPMPKTGPSRAA